MVRRIDTRIILTVRQKQIFEALGVRVETKKDFYTNEDVDMLIIPDSRHIYCVYCYPNYKLYFYNDEKPAVSIYQKSYGFVESRAEIRFFERVIAKGLKLKDTDKIKRLESEYIDRKNSSGPHVLFNYPFKDLRRDEQDNVRCLGYRCEGGADDVYWPLSKTGLEILEKIKSLNFHSDPSIYISKKVANDQVKKVSDELGRLLSGRHEMTQGISSATLAVYKLLAEGKRAPKGFIDKGDEEVDLAKIKTEHAEHCTDLEVLAEGKRAPKGFIDKGDEEILLAKFKAKHSEHRTDLKHGFGLFSLTSLDSSAGWEEVLSNARGEKVRSNFLFTYHYKGTRTRKVLQSMLDNQEITQEKMPELYRNVISIEGIKAPVESGLKCDEREAVVLESARVFK